MPNTTELAHYGILGMQWGKRKGNTSVTRTLKKPKTINESDDHKTTKTLKVKKISEMSNTELKKINERMQLEQNYMQLKQRDISAGRKFIQDILRESAKELIKEEVKSGAKKGIGAAKDFITTIRK